MRARTSAGIAAAVLMGMVGVSGCATKGFVREEVGVVDQKVGAVDQSLAGTRSQVDAQKGMLGQHETRIADLDRTSREALERAQAAGKLAEGKFVYAMVLQDDKVKFRTDKYNLSPDYQAKLSEFASRLKADNRSVYLEIQGHTDATGPKPYNLELGAERAEAVRLFLNQQGIALNRMATISYGQDAPVASNRTRDGRAQNRRVVIVVLA